MGLQDFISEPEAVSLTGMSKTTLSRFAEAGYLQLEVDSDGLRLFSKSELAGLFGLKEPAERSRNAMPPPPKKETPPISVTPVTPVAPTVSVIAAPPLTAPAETTSPSDSEDAVEMKRLQNILQLQEKILDMKDQQIRDLQTQRDWLQARVEKLEDKADRDQLLLLTETQTIRTLVNLNRQTRRSPVRLALEWLGVATPTQQEGETNAVSGIPANTIDVVPETSRRQSA